MRAPVTALAVSLTVLLSSFGAVAQARAGSQAAPEPSAAQPQPFIFGAHVEARPGDTLTTAYKRFEQRVGHELAAARVYYSWDSPFPSPFATWLRQTGHRIFMSVKAKRQNGTYVPWSKIASARRGTAVYSDIVRWAREIKSFGATVYFTFNHEPEAGASDPNGGPLAYRAAWRRIHEIFANNGVRNARYLWIVTSWAFRARDQRAARLWYPGDRYVDAIAADAYNWYHCRSSSTDGWSSLQEMIVPMLAFGALHGKPLFLAEWGSVEDRSIRGRKGTWIANARSLFQQPGYARFRGALYFHDQDPRYTSCKWWANTSDSSMRAFVNMANDPYYS